MKFLLVNYLHVTKLQWKKPIMDLDYIDREQIWTIENKPFCILHALTDKKNPQRMDVVVI